MWSWHDGKHAASEGGQGPDHSVRHSYWGRISFPGIFPAVAGRGVPNHLVAPLSVSSSNDSNMSQVGWQMRKHQVFSHA